MIDLHSHTNQSDGTFTPLELLDLAIERGLEALAISDHDTFAGYRRGLSGCAIPWSGSGVRNRIEHARAGHQGADRPSARIFSA